MEILSGRRGGGNHHLGNKRFQNIVSKIKLIYKGTTNKTVKKELSQHIVKDVKEYGRWFLLKDPQGHYFKMVEPEAVRKTSQALREKNEFTNRLTLVHFCVHALDLLGALETHVDPQQATSDQLDLFSHHSM
jgi:hypothetical protein